MVKHRHDSGDMGDGGGGGQLHGGGNWRERAGSEAAGREVGGSRPIPLNQRRSGAGTGHRARSPCVPPPTP